MVNGLIKTIENQLNIPYTSDRERIGQIIYSVAGKMALASLWDHSDGEEDVSIQHFKRRVQKMLDAYSVIYPDVRFLFPDNQTGLIDDIYDTYLRTGHFYHTPYRISPAAPAMAVHQNCVLHRGAAPDAELFMSGLGFYTVRRNQSLSPVSAMFDLQTQTFAEYLDELVGGGEWETVRLSEDVEYLRIDPPYTREYWRQVPIRDGRITLIRYGEPIKIYAFCRYENGTFLQKAIPYWRLRNDHSQNPENQEEYRRIAVALLMRHGTLPPIHVKVGKELVEISVGYRLPPTEEAFFKLYSWPNSYDITPQSPKVFTRKMAKAVYPVFREHLESLGYRFVEG